MPSLRRIRTTVWVLVLAAAAAAGADRPLAQSAYTVYLPDGRKSLPVHAAGTTEFVSLDQIAAMFGLTVAEDALVGGLSVRGRGQTILLIPGQSFASIGPGRIVSLPGPVQRDRGGWQIPIDFVQKAVGPALNLRIETRKATHIILAGDVHLPQVTGRFDRQGPNVRLVFEAQPAAPHRVTRTGNRVTLKFDAVALEWTPVAGSAPEFVTSVRPDGTSVLIDLGPSAAGYRADDLDPTHIEITLLAPAPVAPPPPPPPPVAAPAAAPPAPAPGRAQLPEPPRPVIDTAPGTVRTIVLDPGHGGDDAGAKGAKGTVEKDYVLQFARRLKDAIESRIGLRVLLTRETDENVPADRRAALANNNKADLFISLHANASVRPAASGLQVLSLRLEDYRAQTDATPAASDTTVAVLGGGTRTIDVLPWDAAQIGVTDRSAAVAGILRQHLKDGGVPLFSRPDAELPLRPLVGVSMPAVLLELGFLTNDGDEQALIAGDRAPRVVEAILGTIADVRNGIPTAASVTH